MSATTAAPPADSRPPGIDKSTKYKKPVQTLSPFDADDDDDETTTDDSSDEAAALEMDSQEVWTQTYCATCDCLIEPGQGISKDTDDTPESGHTSLKSRSGTIKVRPSESHQQTEKEKEKAKPTTAVGGAAANLKRTHSAGRLNTRAANNVPLGPHKRSGSAASRLNALTELRPTTKIYPTQDDKGKAKAQKSAKRPNRNSPSLSRTNSTISVKSSNYSSGPSSVKSNEAVANAETSSARSKARGFLGGLTPAALRQQQAELNAKKKAPAPLYCSERCRLIDESRSFGLGEFTQYLSQPVMPPATMVWSNGPWSAGPTLSAWPASTSMSSVLMPFVTDTPESECMCSECLDKYVEAGSTGGATVPSGASDTTESSSGYMYRRPSTGQKRRTGSGRLITPLNLYHPGGATHDSYFPTMSASQLKQNNNTLSPLIRPLDSVPPRTSSAASGGRASTAETEGSLLSSASGGSLWEPHIRRKSDAVSPHRALEARRNSPAGREPLHRHRLSITSSAAEMNSGLTTTTATPAITPRPSIVASAALSHSVSSRNMHRLSVPAFGPTREQDENEADENLNRLPRSVSVSASASVKVPVGLSTSPLKLLDRTSSHHAAPSVDVFNEHVGSPSTRGSFISQSLASQHTLIPTSNITISNEPSAASVVTGQLSKSHHSSNSKATSLTKSHGSYPSTAIRYEKAKPTSSNRAESLDDEMSLAVGSLKLAQSRADGRSVYNSLRFDERHPDSKPDDQRRSVFGIPPALDKRHSTSSMHSNKGWLKSLSSALANLRGITSSSQMNDGDHNRQHASSNGDEWGGEVSASVSMNSQPRRGSSSSRGSNPFRLSTISSQRPASTKSSDYSTSPTGYGRQNASRSPDPRSLQVDSTETPTQSLVTKPTIRRGRVPAFVREIGHGEIPGETIDSAFDPTSSSYRDGEETNRILRNRADSLQGSQIDTEEERRRRRQEKREARHRRSRDIQVLPPLLAPISRQPSSTNLYAYMPRSAYALSYSRARTPSGSTQMLIGSAGFSHNMSAPPTQRPVTPGHAIHTSGPQSPMVRGSYLAMTQDGRTIVNPPRPKSAASFYNVPVSAGTSPRTKGLGWGAITSIAAPVTPMVPLHSHHGSSASFSHTSALVVGRGLYTSAHPAHRHHPHGGHYAHAGAIRGGYPSRHAGATLTTHPHRHSTMPVALQRSPTPSVPEHGGEMSSHDLTGGEMISRPNSAMALGHHPHRSSLTAPPRSQSSVGVCGKGGHRFTIDQVSQVNESHQFAAVDSVASMQPDRKWSYDTLFGLKTYPVLQLPNRETHDIYNPGWGLGSGGLAKHLTGKALNEETTSSKKADGEQSSSGGQAQPSATPSHRKKLFYFDAF